LISAWQKWKKSWPASSGLSDINKNERIFLSRGFSLFVLLKAFSNLPHKKRASGWHLHALKYDEFRKGAN